MLLSSHLLRNRSPPPRCFTRYGTRERREISLRSSLLSNRDTVASTQAWFGRVVIGAKLCPFAPPIAAANTLRIVASAAVDEKQAVADVKNEVHLLLLGSNWADAHDTGTSKDYAIGSKKTPQHETTLVVFDAPFVRNFRDFVRLSWTLQEDVVVRGGYQEDLQLVLFHPVATHQTYSSDECHGTAADYTIRSPYPVIHLLREVDVMRAVTGSYPNLEELPARNKQKLLAQGLSVCKARLEECYILDDDRKEI